MSALLFPDLPRSRPRQILMHVSDAGNAPCMSEGDAGWVEMTCRKCGHRSEHTDLTIKKARYGVPCPKCNKETKP